MRSIPISRIPVIQRLSHRPRTYLASTEHYLLNESNAGTKLISTAAGSIDRIRPISPDGKLPPLIERAIPVRWPQQTAFLLRNVHVIGGYSSAFVTQNLQLLGDLSPDIFGSANHELFGRLRLPTSVYLPGRTCVLATPEAAGNYSHWLFDLLPRLLLIEEAGIALSEFDHYIVNSLQPGYQTETLTAFGIPCEKVILINQSKAFLCQEAVTTTLRNNHWQHTLSPNELERVANRLYDLNTPLPSEAPGRIWLSRRNAPFRRLVNESSLQDLLSDYSLQYFNPESYTLKEQAAIFRNAELIAGPHTSAMCNWMFCRSGTPVLEIASPYHHDVSFWTVASFSRLRYGLLEGEYIDGIQSGIATRFLNYGVDPTMLRSALSQMSQLV